MVENEKYELTKLLIQRYGPLITGENLVQALGYRSADAFRQSKYQNTVPIRIFKIKNRRGYYALVTDLSDWLISQRN